MAAARTLRSQLHIGPKETERRSGSYRLTATGYALDWPAFSYEHFDRYSQFLDILRDAEQDGSNRCRKAPRRASCRQEGSDRKAAGPPPRSSTVAPCMVAPPQDSQSAYVQRVKAERNLDMVVVDVGVAAPPDKQIQFYPSSCALKGSG